MEGPAAAQRGQARHRRLTGANAATRRRGLGCGGIPLSPTTGVWLIVQAVPAQKESQIFRTNHCDEPVVLPDVLFFVC